MRTFRTTFAALVVGLLGMGCGSSDQAPLPVGKGGQKTGGAKTAGATAAGGTNAGAPTNAGGKSATSGGTSSTLTGGTAPGSGGQAVGGRSSSGGSSVGGTRTGGGATGGNSTGGASSGGTSTSGATGGGSAVGGASGGGQATGGSSTGGGATGGNSTGGTSSGGGSTGGGSSGGTSSGGTATGGSSSTWYPCDGTTTGYNAVVTQSGSTYTVVNGGTQVYSGTIFEDALTQAYGSLTPGRTTKESVLVDASGDISGSSQVGIPSYTIVNFCGTINVASTPSGSDRSPVYSRGTRDVDIPNLAMTGTPQYGIFFRLSDNIHLGRIDLRLSASSPGIGIRVDNHPANGTVALNQNLTIDYVYGTGMSSHIVETYGINNLTIGTVEGDTVGQCGLLLNRTTNAEVGRVTCNDCAIIDQGYAAFRIANNAGMIGTEWPAGNIHVGEVYARGGGRGIFSVTASGGLTIDRIDIANTGSTPILLQNCYNTTIAAVSGTVVGGDIRVSNDTANTNPTDGRVPLVTTRNVTIQNLTLSGGANLLEDWCNWNNQGDVGNQAINVTGGTVSLCY